MKVFQFVIDNWDDILIILFLLVSGIIGLVKWITHKYTILKDMTPEEKIAYSARLLENLVPIALNLVTEAEARYGSGTGVIKRASVIDQLYTRIPDEFKKYINESNLDNIIEKALEQARDLWENNKNIKALIEPMTIQPIQDKTNE